MKKNSQNHPRIFGLHIVEMVAILAVAVGYLGYGLFQGVSAQSGLPVIDITSPAGGEKWTVGEMRTISWRLDEAVKLPTRIFGQLAYRPQGESGTGTPFVGLWSEAVYDMSQRSGSFNWKVGYQYSTTTSQWTLMKEPPGGWDKVEIALRMNEEKFFESNGRAAWTWAYSGWFDVKLVRATSISPNTIYSNYPQTQTGYIVGRGFDNMPPDGAGKLYFGVRREVLRTGDAILWQYRTIGSLTRMANPPDGLDERDEAWSFTIPARTDLSKFVSNTAYSYFFVASASVPEFNPPTGIRIVYSDNPTAADNILISAAPVAPSITIGSPKEGDVWYWGDDRTIEFTTTNIPSKAVDIVLTGGPITFEDVLIESLSVPTDGARTYTWRLDITEVFCGVYPARIIVRDAGDDTIFGTSPDFVIKLGFHFSTPPDNTCEWPGALVPVSYRAGETVTLVLGRHDNFNPSGTHIPALYYHVKTTLNYGQWIEIINGAQNFNVSGNLWKYDWTVPALGTNYEAQLMFAYDTALAPNSPRYFARSVPINVTQPTREPNPLTGFYISAAMPLPIGANKVLKSIDQFEANYDTPGGSTVGFMIGFLDASGNFIIGDNPNWQHPTYGSFYNVTLGQAFNFNRSWLKDAASVKIRIIMATTDINDPAQQPRVASAGITYTLGDKVSGGDKIMVTLTLITPFEGQTYDYATNQRVHVIVYNPSDLTHPIFNACYKIMAGGGAVDPFIELPGTELVKDTSYSAWIKGIRHLAVAKTFGPTQAGALEVKFDTAALIGDLISKASTSGNDSFNLLNAQDWSIFLQDYLKEGLNLLADFNASEKVDVSDYSAFFYKNYGKSGAPYPLGSSFDKNICWPTSP